MIALSRSPLKIGNARTICTKRREELANCRADRCVVRQIVVFGRIPGLEIVQPTAIVIIGGLVASTLFTLFVIPALYLVIGAGAERQSDLGLARS